VCLSICHRLVGGLESGVCTNWLVGTVVTVREWKSWRSYKSLIFFFFGRLEGFWRSEDVGSREVRAGGVGVIEGVPYCAGWKSCDITRGENGVSTATCRLCLTHTHLSRAKTSTA
jgi:hypothetical protein